ncbi:hypothetical protein OROMI_014975 [Orobanche minor]
MEQMISSNQPSPFTLDNLPAVENVSKEFDGAVSLCMNPPCAYAKEGSWFSDLNDTHSKIIMSSASAARGSAYLNALAIEIEKKLQRALTAASQRRNLLQELFADVALEVDDRAKDIIFGGKGTIYEADDGYGGPVCFYDVLADHFVSMPQNGKSILDLIVQLWSQSFASNIFCLLFHKWIFEGHLDNPEVLLRYSSALVEVIDIQTNARRFQSLFLYLLLEVALCPQRLKKIPLQAQWDLFLLLSRYLFFYNSVDNLESFLKQFPNFPNAFLISGASDIFVMELADQLQKLKVEPALLHYLSQIKVLKGLELRMATTTRLKTSLYSFTSPGGPMYPTRAVRHAAWESIDFLFPVLGDILGI